MSLICQAFEINFEEFNVGQSLTDWEQGFYGTKGSPQWKIAKDSTSPSKSQVLKQDGKAIYSWLVKKDLFLSDGFVQAHVKIVSGDEDPEAGLVWQHLDAKNYLYVRLNAKKDNIVFYKMTQGKKEIVKEAETKIGFNKWHHLKILFKGEHVDVYFDKKPVISISDKILKGQGRVGFFTTADTVSVSDNFNAESLKDKK